MPLSTEAVSPRFEVECASLPFMHVRTLIAAVPIVAARPLLAQLSSAPGQADLVGYARVPTRSYCVASSESDRGA